MNTRITTLSAILAATTFGTSTFGQESPPDQLVLTGVVRDFVERTKSGGHPDFERRPDGGFGHYMGNVASYLDEDGKPLFVGGGRKVRTQWQSGAGYAIHPSLYDPTAGDIAGSYYDGTDNGGIQSADSFSKWFRDEHGVNMRAPLEMILTRSGGTDEQPVYSFESESFFPIDNQLFGNSGGTPDHNFHFTFELHTEFTYDADMGQVFSFYGDDDVFVYINGQLVIDIGGVHSKVQQVVEVDRLGLEDGKTYKLDFFFAERHRTQSNFRIDTTLTLANADVPNGADAYD